MLRPIDRFVSALHRQSAEELLLETGKPGRLRLGVAERVLLAQEIRTDQIELLLRDVLPEDCQRNFHLDGEIAFPYKAPTGPVLIRVRRSGDRLAVSVRSYTNQGTTSQSPPPPPRMPPPIITGQRTAPNGQGKAKEEAARYGRSDGRAEVAPRGAAVMAKLPAPIALGKRAVTPLEIEPTSFSELPAPLPAYDPKAIPMGNTASGETGPIELELITGNLPLMSGSDVQQLESADIIGPVVSGTSAVKLDVAAGRAEPANAPAPDRHASPVELVPAKALPPRVARGRIDPLLRALVEAGGSDLHITAGLVPRMRKDGDMCNVPGWSDPLESATIESWLLEIAPDKSRARFQATNDADYGYELPGIARLRVNAFRDRRGVGGVFRVIPAQVLTADQLRLPQAVRDLTTLHKGLVVVTGPTGSGKSTTLAAMIDLANKTRADHIITIEDPVEFVHVPDRCLINQREVHSDTESFSSGLRAALREDPDIVLVGEMRDLETVAIAVETAETGHLVFGTLHTTTAMSTVDRIVDQFPTDRQQQIRVMLSSALKGVVAQTLCKKIGGGRVAALEILLVVPAVANLIREAKTFQLPSVMQTGKALGMQTLNDALFALAQEKIVAPEEALQKSVARTELRAMLEKANLVKRGE